MPTATKFMGLRAFPSCGQKVNVAEQWLDDSTGEYRDAQWVTLGGVSSGGATQEQIDLSLRNAMKLYYNSYSIKGTSLKASSNGTFFSSNFQENSSDVTRSSEVESASKTAIYNKKDTDDNSVSAYAPIERVCFQSNFISKRANFSDSEEDDDERVGRLSKSTIYLNHSTGGLIRMYNGSTDNEDNFVGYGVDSVAMSSATTRLTLPSGNGRIYLRVSVEVSSIIGGEDDSGVDTINTGNTFDQKVSTVTLGGMDFISMCRCEGRTRGDSYSETETAELEMTAGGLTGSATADFSIVRDYSYQPSIAISEGEGECETTIDSIEFYTY